MIFKSLLPDIEIPAMGIYQYVTSNPNGISDDKVIFTDGITDKKLTYGELKSNSKKLAAGLIDKAGFKRGDVLAIISPNQVCRQYICCLFYIIIKCSLYSLLLGRLRDCFIRNNCSRWNCDFC